VERPRVGALLDGDPEQQNPWKIELRRRKAKHFPTRVSGPRTVEGSIFGREWRGYASSLNLVPARTKRRRQSRRLMVTTMAAITMVAPSST
jgi:hypothetical protein